MSDPLTKTRRGCNSCQSMSIIPTKSNRMSVFVCKSWNYWRIEREGIHKPWPRPRRNCKLYLRGRPKVVGRLLPDVLRRLHHHHPDHLPPSDHDRVIKKQTKYTLSMTRNANECTATRLTFYPSILKVCIIYSACLFPRRSFCITAFSPSHIFVRTFRFAYHATGTVPTVSMSSS